LLKEWYLIRSQKLIAASMAVFVILGAVMTTVRPDVGAALCVLAMFYLSSLSLSLEYKYSGERFLSALPIRRADLALGKFIFLLLASGVLVLAGLAVSGLYAVAVAAFAETAHGYFRSSGIAYAPFPLGALSMAAAFGLVVGSAAYTAYFFLGYRKYRLFTLIPVVVAFSGYGAWSAATGRPKALAAPVAELAGRPGAVAAIIAAALSLWALGALASGWALARRDLSLPLGDAAQRAAD